MGLDTSGFADDETFKTALETAIEQNESDRRLAELGRQFAPVATEFPAFLEWQKQQQSSPGSGPQAPEDAVPEPPKFEWNVPALDPRLVQACERDPRTNMFRPIEGMPLLPGTAEKLNEIESTRGEMANRLLTEFPSLVNDVTAPIIDGLKSEIAELKAAFTTSQERQDSLDYERQRGNDFYQHDEQGNIVLSQTGQPVLSPVGESHRNVEQALMKTNWDDPADRRMVVESFLELQKKAKVGPFAEAAGANGQPAPQVTPVEQGVAAGEVKRRRFLERAIQDQRSTDRAGTIPDPTAPSISMQNADDDNRRIIRDLAREQGISLS